VQLIRAVDMYLLNNKVIILNSPANSGKDYLATTLCKATGASHSEFKSWLYQCTSTLFNVPLEALRGLAVDRATKEVPCEELYLGWEGCIRLKELLGNSFFFNSYTNCGVNLSPREALIYTSEIVIKPNFSKEYFGKAAADNIDMIIGAVFSDGGFREELLPIINKAGAENVYVVQFTRDGADSFEGDSRDWLPQMEGVNMLRTTNNGTIEELSEEILKWVNN